MTVPEDVKARGSNSPSGPSAFQRFFRTEALGGLLLFVSGIAAMIIANSPWSATYEHLWETRLSLGPADHPLTLTLHGWINDGLMAVFFLLVGLEIKRELVAGELASPRQAALPIAGAIGGMVAPAFLYWLLNAGQPGVNGWGIPMATDIAFALGALAVVAPSVPIGAKVFLAALAIVDDMGAVIVIALFYTSAVSWSALASAGLTLLVLMALNRAGVCSLTPFLLLGIVVWYFVHESGVHATVAGVLVAMTVPTRTRINAMEFSNKARGLLDDFDRTETGDLLVLTSKGQQEALFALEHASEEVNAPLLRLEHALHNLSAFVVMPLFALANASVVIGDPRENLNVTFGVLAGLLIGKPFGITGAALVAQRLGFASLPAGVSWTLLHGCAWLGGIGFTMSLFITMLAFDDQASIRAAKIAILFASLAAGLVATAVLRRAERQRVARS